MKAGDIVYHRPSKETWVLACAFEEHVWPCGWPETRAKAADCRLITSCDEAESLAMTAKWAKSRNEDHYDERTSICRELFGLWQIAAGFDPIAMGM